MSGGGGPARPPAPGQGQGPRRPGFESVGGLEEHIRCLKELVLFPLMYKDLYARFHMKPPRGVLFHGPPGTGKTLVAGALASECSQGERRVAFFSRKGADCYSKYVGESEQRLRSLFEEARILQPSIIFFDEVDGLAPTRSSRHDIVHSSVVSTLLALMDGLDSAHDVIVIGATNRIDAIDPALRRPGRFDKELFFPLPAHQARADILRVHLRHWRRRPPDSLVQQLAASTVGYCGSDLQALCTEAVLCGLRRAYPDIYACNNRLKINLSTLVIEERDFQSARGRLVAASHRVLSSPVQRLSPQLRPLLQAQLDRAAEQLRHAHPRSFLFPHLADSAGEVDAGRCPALLLAGDGQHGQTPYLAPALLHRLEHLPVTVIDIASLFEHSARATEEACIHRMRQARLHLPGILYLPDLTSWWDLVDEATRAVFLTLASRLDGTTPLLVLATAHCPHRELPPSLQQLWSEEHGDVFAPSPPTAEEREAYFRPLLMTKAVAPPPAAAAPLAGRGSATDGTGAPQQHRAAADREDGVDGAVSPAESASSSTASLRLSDSECRVHPGDPEDAAPGADEDDDMADEDAEDDDAEPLHERVSRLLSGTAGKGGGPYYLRSRQKRGGRSRSRGRRRTPAARARTAGPRTLSRGSDRSRSRSRRGRPHSSRPPSESSSLSPRGQDPEPDDSDSEGRRLDDDGCVAEVHVDRAGLGGLLRRVVRVTADRPVRALEALHASLAAVVARFASRADRRGLLQDLEAVVDLYQQRGESQGRGRAPGSAAPP